MVIRLLRSRFSPLVCGLIAGVVVAMFLMGNLTLPIPRLGGGDVKIRLFLPALFAAFQSGACRSYWAGFILRS